MGCLRLKQTDDELSPCQYRIVWIKSLELQLVRLNSPNKYTHPSFPQVMKDLDRTFPDIPQFNTPAMHTVLQTVLKKFALHFPKVGYTQGLNFIAGNLLLNNLSQSQTLKVLIALCTRPDLMFLGMYEDNFPLCKLYCQIFWIAIRHLRYQSSELLRALNLPDQIWIFQWFLTLFVYSLPSSYLNQMFNFVFVKRLFAPIRLAIAVFMLIEQYFGNVRFSEDRLIEFFCNMKNEQFCRQHLPLQRIIKKAENIKQTFLFQCLRQSKTSNFYKHYFLCASDQRLKKHKRFMQDLQVQRQRFVKDNMQDSSRYTRQLSSVLILDNIEVLRSKRMSRVVSNKDNIQQFFSNGSLRRCNSLRSVQSKT